MVAAHGLSCSVACGIFPTQGSNPCLQHWQVDSLPLSHQGSSKVCFCFNSWLSWLSLHCCEGFSLAAASGDCSLVTMHGLLSVVVSLVSAHGLSSCRFSCLVAYVGSSRSRDQTHVPCTSRQTQPLNHQGSLTFSSLLRNSSGKSLHMRPGQNHFLWDVSIFFITTTFLIYADKLTFPKCLWLPI